MGFIICLLIFIGLCIYHACEKELPADYHNNWRLEEHDAQLVREGKMTKRQFLKKVFINSKLEILIGLHLICKLLELHLF